MKQIISAFPATGKTYLTNKLRSEGKNVQDSDSSGFSKDENFPNNYLDHIRNSDSEIIFVSTHQVVVEAILNDPELSENYLVVIPDIFSRDEIKERMIKRGSPEKLVEIVSKSYYLWVEWIMENIPTEKLRILESGQYLSDAVE